MKTLTTIFAIAVMVFAFNTNVSANEAQLEALRTLDCNISASGSGFANKENCPEISEVETLDQEEKNEAVAFFGWGFCTKYSGAGFCEDDSWWRPNELNGTLASLSDEEIDQKIAGAIDYCQKNDCALLNSDGESEIALTQPIRNLDLFCERHPSLWLCEDDWWNEDADSKDGFGGRDVADSGEEGSTSAAGANEQ